MSTRVTAKDVRATAALVAEDFASFGIIAPDYMPADSKLILQEGSSTYARAYRLMWQDPNGGGLSGAWGDMGYLGMTAREALCALEGMRSAFRLIPATELIGHAYANGWQGNR